MQPETLPAAWWNCSVGSHQAAVFARFEPVSEVFFMLPSVLSDARLADFLGALLVEPLHPTHPLVDTPLPDLVAARLLRITSLPGVQLADGWLVWRRHGVVATRLALWDALAATAKGVEPWSLMAPGSALRGAGAEPQTHWPVKQPCSWRGYDCDQNTELFALVPRCAEHGGQLRSDIELGYRR